MKTTRTLPGKVAGICWRSVVASALQYGHWKSPKTQIDGRLLIAAIARLARDVQFVQRVLEGALVQVPYFALENLLAIARDVVVLVERRLFVRQVHRELIEARHAVHGFGIVNLDVDVGNPQFDVPQVGFELGFIDLGRGGLRRRPLPLRESRDANEKTR